MAPPSPVVTNIAPAAIPPADTASAVTPPATPQATDNTPNTLDATHAPSDSPPDNSLLFNTKDASALLKDIAGSDIIFLDLDGSNIQADINDPLHIDEAVAFALKNNFEVQAADKKLKSAYWDKMGGYAEYVPSVMAGADGGRERSEPASVEDIYGNRILDNLHHRSDHSVSVTQPLIDLGIISDILSGTDKEDIAAQERLDSREGIAYDTVAAYLSLMEARIAVKLADDYKKYLDNLAARMKKRVEGGGATEADYQRITSRSTIAESARIEALGTYQTDMAELKRLMRVIPKRLVLPTVLIPSVPEVPESAIESALKSNPSYQSSLKKIDVARDDRDKSLSGLMPKLSLQYNNTFSFNAGGSAEGTPVEGAYPTQRNQQIMLVAQFALDGGTSVTGALSGNEKIDEMSLHAEDARTRIEQGIVSSYLAMNAAKQRHDVLAKSIDADRQVVNGFESQFTNGSRSLFDLLDAYEQLYNARLNLLRVSIAHAKAAYQVHRMMGDLGQSILGSEGK